MKPDSANKMTDRLFPHLPARKYYRTVFLSDFHMGAKSFDAAAVLDFLKSMECEYLYLVGDIIDGWKLKKRWYWTENCNRVIDEIIRKNGQGTKIIYLPGNHDDEVRHVMPLVKSRFLRKYGIRVKERTVHTLHDGRRFLVMHGDQFDRKILKGPLSKFSDRLYDRAMDLLNRHNHVQITIKGQKKPFSLAKYLGKHSKRALQLLNNFENAIYKAAKSRNLDGVICGHTHIPVLKNIKDITYGNSGSWLRFGHTALVELETGELQLVDWPFSSEKPSAMPALFKDHDLGVKLVPDSYPYRHITNQIVHTIRKTWRQETMTQSFSRPSGAQSLITRLEWLNGTPVHKPLEIC